MPEKKFSEPNTGTPVKSLKRPKNLLLNATISSRGFDVAREFGYEAGEFVERILEELWIQRQRIKKRKRGDSIQFELFDRAENLGETPRAKGKG